MKELNKISIAFCFANFLELVAIVLFLTFEIKLRKLKGFPYTITVAIIVYAALRSLFISLFFIKTNLLTILGILTIIPLAIIAANFRVKREAIPPILIDVASYNLLTLINGVHLATLTWILFGVKKNIPRKMRFARDMITLTAYLFAVFHICFLISYWYNFAYIEFVALLPITASAIMLYASIIVNSSLRWWI